jgi:phosphatidylserine/phosphatidylglycerophosphate/cardiolipin synthase-like enzyme
MIFFSRFIVIFFALVLALSAQAQTSKKVSTPKSSSSSNVSVSTEQPIEVYFGPKATDDKNSVFFNLLRFFDSAKTSLYGSAHEIDMIAVAEKLIERAEAGVDVQIVVESRWLSLPKNSASLNLLRNSKVKLIPDTKKSGLMHNKFFIADKKRVWTGSTNLTEHCLLFNYNNGIWLENDRLAQNFLTEFFEEREGKFGKKGSGRPNTPYPTLAVGSAKVSTYFSPEDLPMPQIVSLINRAKKTVDIMCFVFSSEEISEALILAKKRGVKVRILFDNSFSSQGITSRWRYVPFNKLGEVGISCKYDDEAAKIHHKVIIVDSQEVLTGSFNLSNNAAKSNDENLLIVDSPYVAGNYQKEFDRLWNFFNGDTGETVDPDEEDIENGNPIRNTDDDDDDKEPSKPNLE